MSARIFMIVMSFLSICFSFWKRHINEIQRKKPLPKEVSDIYNKERYDTFLAYNSEYKKVAICVSIGVFLIDSAIILSDLYLWVENLCNGNVYLIALCTFLIIHVIEIIEDIIVSYYSTFYIEEKYGLNKKTKKEFAKDMLLNEIFYCIAVTGIILLISYIGEHMRVWTNDFSISFGKALLLVVIMYAVLKLFTVALNFLSYILLKKQYTFTELPEGDLKDKINQMQEGAKKKVKKIYVYNESKKTTEKNAFLIKLLWHREFGIADNFMNENEERELLAVLAHEIGHLKHKKNVWNYLNYAGIIIFTFVAVYFVSNPGGILLGVEWVRESFELAANNYYVLLLIILAAIRPIMFLSGLFDNYVSRREEYEADDMAVKYGYGKELISTFKNMGSDELIDVNPHPVIEFIDYDHPGMCNRIKHIEETIQKTS